MKIIGTLWWCCVFIVAGCKQSLMTKHDLCDHIKGQAGMIASCAKIYRDRYGKWPSTLDGMLNSDLDVIFEREVLHGGTSAWSFRFTGPPNDTLELRYLGNDIPERCRNKVFYISKDPRFTFEKSDQSKSEQ